jgi:hypothetical protein
VKKILMTAIAACAALTSCTEQQRARSYGGTARTELAVCQKLVLVTWKTDSLWILTRPMTRDDIAVSYQFKEDSAYGMLEGTVVLNEHKGPGCQ